MLHSGYRVASCGHLTVPADWSLTPERTRRWEDCDLWYLFAGRGHVEHEGRRLPLLPGSCLLMRGGLDYTLRYDPGRPFTHAYVHFSPLDAAGRAVPPLEAVLPPLHRLLPDTTLAEALVWRICDGGPGAEVYLAAMLAEIERADAQAESARPHRFCAACRSIDADPARRWSIAALAAEAGLSRAQFYRTFTAETGLSPQQYVTRARMVLARSLLCDSAMPIALIASRLSYSDIYAFSSHFSAQHGCSPRHYRQRAGLPPS